MVVFWSKTESDRGLTESDRDSTESDREWVVWMVGLTDQ